MATSSVILLCIIHQWHPKAVLQWHVTPYQSLLDPIFFFALASSSAKLLNLGNGPIQNVFYGLCVKLDFEIWPLARLQILVNRRGSKALKAKALRCFTVVTNNIDLTLLTSLTLIILDTSHFFN